MFLKLIIYFELPFIHFESYFYELCDNQITWFASYEHLIIIKLFIEITILSSKNMNYKNN